MTILADKLPGDVFECNVCQKTFGSFENLKRHQILHTGEKPFKCDSCPKNFSQTVHLMIHKRIHTGEIPFKSPPSVYSNSGYTPLSPNTKKTPLCDV
jgi:uncharacterized Zn-finger protein